VAVITSKGLARFAAFELDLRAGELRKDGAKQVRLPEQPFRILTMLLERPGQVVSREEIRKTLWPNDTVVEFEHSISAAMNRLRQALGDSADHPRYIETLARGATGCWCRWNGRSLRTRQPPLGRSCRLRRDRLPRPPPGRPKGRPYSPRLMFKERPQS